MSDDTILRFDDPLWRDSPHTVVRVGGHTLTITGDRITLTDHNLRAEIAHVLLGGTPCLCLAYALVLEYYSYPTSAENPSLLWSFDDAAWDRTMGTGAGDEPPLSVVLQRWYHLCDERWGTGEWKHHPLRLEE